MVDDDKDEEDAEDSEVRGNGDDLDDLPRGATVILGATYGE